jgi:hypothetical protein
MLSLSVKFFGMYMMGKCCPDLKHIHIENHACTTYDEAVEGVLGAAEAGPGVGWGLDYSIIDLLLVPMPLNRSPEAPSDQ